MTLARADPEAEPAREAGHHAQRRRCTSPLLLRFFDPQPSGTYESAAEPFDRLGSQASVLLCDTRQTRKPEGVRPWGA
jgi:hypothetical protein